MDNLIITIVLASILMLLVVVGLGLGLILTGKTKLRKGCGLSPKKDKEGNCPLCGDDKTCKAPEKKDAADQ